MQIHIDTTADEIAALITAIQEHRVATTGPVKLDGNVLSEAIKEATCKANKVVPT